MHAFPTLPLPPPSARARQRDSTAVLRALAETPTERARRPVREYTVMMLRRDTTGDATKDTGAGSSKPAPQGKDDAKHEVDDSTENNKTDARGGIPGADSTSAMNIAPSVPRGYHDSDGEEEDESDMRASDAAAVAAARVRARAQRLSPSLPGAHTDSVLTNNNNAMARPAAQRVTSGGFTSVSGSASDNQGVPRTNDMLTVSLPPDSTINIASGSGERSNKRGPLVLTPLSASQHASAPYTSGQDVRGDPHASTTINARHSPIMPTRRLSATAATAATHASAASPDSLLSTYCAQQGQDKQGPQSST